MNHIMRSAIALVIAAAIVSAAQPALTTTTAARAMQPGELIVVTITSSRPFDDVRVRAFDHDVPAFRAGGRTWQALVGIDLDVRPGRYAIDVDAGAGAISNRDSIALTVRNRVFPTRRLKVDPSFVNPPPDVQSRIEEETRLLNALWTTSTSSRLWDGRFIQPVKGSANSRFGARSIFNGEPRGRHNGEDFPGEEGTPVAAPNAGRIALARHLYFSGNTVVIDHGLGLFSLLAHLSAMDVKPGERVVKEQRIGRVGATGRVTGPHLHWAVRINGARIDPSSLLAALGGAN